MSSESDATAWKPLLLFCVYSANHPRGAASTTSNPHPSTLSHSHQLHHSSFPFSQSDQGVWMEHCEHFSCGVHLCNKIKPSPFLPDLIRRTLRLIGSPCRVSAAVFSRLMWLCSFVPADLHWHAHTAWNRATPLTLSSASHYRFLFARPGEQCCYFQKRLLSIIWNGFSSQNDE